MLTRIRGQLDHLEGHTAAVIPDGLAGLTLGVALPAYLAADLTGRTLVGTGPVEVEFHTLLLFEGTSQGVNLTPRLIGFANPSDRAFFELFTTVKGLGARRGLRAMARPPAWIAGRIAERDTKALQELPEIGKRLADTMVAELSGKVADFALAQPSGTAAAAPAEPAMEGPAAEAVGALVALGQTRAEAERLIGRATSSLGDDADPQALIAAALTGAS